MNVTAQKFQSLCVLVCKSLARSNQRTTLPQSALAGCQLPQRGSRERLRGLLPFNRVLAKPWGCGRFSSPLRNSECLTAPIHRGTLPLRLAKSRLRRLLACIAPAGVPAPSEREPGMGTTIAWVAILRTIPELCRRGGFQGGKSPPLKSDKKVSITLDNGKNPWYTVQRLRKEAGIVYA